MKQHKWQLQKGIVLLGAAFLSVLLAGCGAETKKEQVELSVWGNTQDQELLQQMADSFAAYYAQEADICVTICEESEGNCKDTVLFCPQAAADVFYFADDQFRALLDGGALLSLSYEKDLVIAENGGSENAAVLAASDDGNLYAYPVTASNGYFLYYDAAYFSETDVKSLDRMLEICSENGKKLGMEFTSGWYLYSFFEGAGLHVYTNEDGVTNYCNWNTTEGTYQGVEVAQALLELVQHPGFTNVDNNALLKGVASGEIIACISGTWNSSDIESAYGSGYEATRLPAFTVAGDLCQMHSVAGYKLVGVNAYSNQQSWAQKLARWMTNEENQTLRFRVNGEGPSNRAVAATEEVQRSKAIAALTSQSEFGHLQRVADSYWSATYKFTNILASGNVEGVPLQALLDELVDAVTTAP